MTFSVWNLRPWGADGKTSLFGKEGWHFLIFMKSLAPGTLGPHFYVGCGTACYVTSWHRCLLPTASCLTWAGKCTHLFRQMRCVLTSCAHCHKGAHTVYPRRVPPTPTRYPGCLLTQELRVCIFAHTGLPTPPDDFLPSVCTLKTHTHACKLVTPLFLALQQILGPLDHDDQCGKQKLAYKLEQVITLMSLDS